MTLSGTNTYLVGTGPVYVIDPGPADERHAAAVREAADARGGIAGLVLTHSHSDHSGAVPLLDAPLLWGHVSDADELADLAQRSPERPAAEAGSVGPFEVLPTPGHAPDHVAFLYGGVCFCGDLVLGEGSSIVPPGGGTLAAYLDSLALLRSLPLELLCPGHGPWIADPAAKLDEYRAHRLERERMLLDALERGERSRQALLDAAWRDVPLLLRPAAALAMEAHLAKLEDEGRLPAGVER